jgi:DNA-binding transcriptional LysR family regulator
VTSTQSDESKLYLRLLRSFLAVAQCGKISTAAKQLHLSQPAVTAHLRRLEEIAGKALIFRSTRSVKLTAQGHSLQTLVSETQNTLSRVEASFHREQKLAVSCDSAPAALSQPRSCQASSPNSAVSIQTSSLNYELITPEGVLAVREGVYPFGLVEGNSRAAGLRLEQFVADEVVLVAGTNPMFRAYQRLPDDSQGRGGRDSQPRISAAETLWYFFPL